MLYTHSGWRFASSHFKEIFNNEENNVALLGLFPLSWVADFFPNALID
jgi:hypothetical protein